MTSYEFSGNLYRTRSAMIDGAVYEWWTAGGGNSPEQIDALGCSADGRPEAEEMINEWGLDVPDYETGGSWTKDHDITTAELADAILEFWWTRPDRETVE